ncbi:MAG: ABC transporter ATP-binding protein [Bacteroidales bacterium]|nr:ABC transporter ATP-binding protein [Bacteroidales bacterium]MDT8373067.1 ABC transporter ATP-binding protein [Bacteroidales bacterium]
MIKVSGILKSYGDLKVLKGIDLEVREKEVVAIVGASGAGKTTLLQIIGTLDRPDAGTILYNGQDVGTLSQRSLSAFRNRNIGFVFQFHQLLPEFTALENVSIPALIAGKSRAEAADRASELLSFLGLGDRLDHKPSQLSGGEQQRVAVARAIVNSPSLILADEPSGNLDTENKKELHNLFFRLRDTFGHTFIIVTHDPQLASMSDRTIRIKDGQITQ